MGAKIITKTDRQMEDRMHAVADDPERAATLQKARAFTALLEAAASWWKLSK